MYYSDNRWFDCNNAHVNTPQPDDSAGAQAIFNSGFANLGNVSQNVELSYNPGPSSDCNVHYQVGSFFGVAYSKIKIKFRQLRRRQDICQYRTISFWDYGGHLVSITNC